MVAFRLAIFKVNLDQSVLNVREKNGNSTYVKHQHRLFQSWVNARDVGPTLKQRSPLLLYLNITPVFFWDPSSSWPSRLADEELPLLDAKWLSIRRRKEKEVIGIVVNLYGDRGLCRSGKFQLRTGVGWMLTRRLRRWPGIEPTSRNVCGSTFLLRPSRRYQTQSDRWHQSRKTRNPSPGAGSMLGHRRRRWPNIEPTPGERFFANTRKLELRITRSLAPGSCLGWGVWDDHSCCIIRMMDTGNFQVIQICCLVLRGSVPPR